MRWIGQSEWEKALKEFMIDSIIELNFIAVKMKGNHSLNWTKTVKSRGIIRLNKRASIVRYWRKLNLSKERAANLMKKRLKKGSWHLFSLVLRWLILALRRSLTHIYSLHLLLQNIGLKKETSLSQKMKNFPVLSSRFRRTWILTTVTASLLSEFVLANLIAGWTLRFSEPEKRLDYQILRSLWLIPERSLKQR